MSFFELANQLKPLQLTSSRYEKHGSHFLGGTNLQAGATHTTLGASAKMLLQKTEEQLNVDGAPIQRLYRKTMAGAVVLVVSAFRHLGLKK